MLAGRRHWKQTGCDWFWYSRTEGGGFALLCAPCLAEGVESSIFCLAEALILSIYRLIYRQGRRLWNIGTGRRVMDGRLSSGQKPRLSLT